MQIKPMQPNCFFLVIEGLDGSGKTDLSRRLRNELDDADQRRGNIKLTFEPHDPSCAGLYIRQILARKRKRFDARALALAFAANRADHVERDIKPFLDKGQGRVVICDRYYLSSLVYQSIGDISMEQVWQYNAGAQRPDLIIFLNASDSTCYQRMRERSESKELFEVHLKSTRNKYRTAIELLRGRGDNIIEVQADGSRDEVLNAVLDVLVEHGPHWLNVQRSLFSDEEDPNSSELHGRQWFSIQRSLFTEEDSTINELNEFDKPSVEQFIIAGTELMKSINVSNMEGVVEKANTLISNLSQETIEVLFSEFLQLHGYRINGYIPWSETKAIEIEYKLPFGAEQRGIALSLSRFQSASLLTRKIIDAQAILLDRDKDVPTFSDFMICLDFNNAANALQYYGRDINIEANHMTPTVMVLTCADLCVMIVAFSIALIEHDRYFTIINSPDLKKSWSEFYSKISQESHMALNLGTAKRAVADYMAGRP